MNENLKDAALFAMQDLMKSALDKSAKKNVTRAVFNASYVDDFRLKQAYWRSKWLNRWFTIGLIASFISFASWALAMMPRFGVLHIDEQFIGWLLFLTAFATVTSWISAVGIFSVGNTPKLPNLL